MGQALSGVAEAYSSPGQPLRTGIVSVADESCATLTFGGILAAVISAQKTGRGQKVKTSLLDAQVRMMGWGWGSASTTTMWCYKNPVTGQARINGTAQRPAMSASFEDQDGKPFVFQLKGLYRRNAMTALGFYEELETIELGDLGVVLNSNDKRDKLLSTLDACFARGHCDRWVKILRETDIVAAPINALLEASNDPDVLANEYVTKIEYPEFG